MILRLVAGMALALSMATAAAAQSQPSREQEVCINMQGFFFADFHITYMIGPRAPRPMVVHKFIGVGQRRCVKNEYLDGAVFIQVSVFGSAMCKIEDLHARGRTVEVTVNGTAEAPKVWC